MKTPTTIDFETKPIESRPLFPPVPVGAAIRTPEGKSRYMAWGHPTGNNCTVTQARAQLADAWKGPVLFHNGPFDIDVAECHLGLSKPKEIHDSLFTLFLHDPYEDDLSLKPLADKHLSMAPKERDDLKDLIFQYFPKEAKKRKTKWGELIWRMPGDKVALYAEGDVDRTFGLWNKLYPDIVKRGMLEAYEREINLIPITIEMERSGVRINVKRLRKCGDTFEKMDRDLLRRIAKKLRVDSNNLKSETNKKGFNINSGDQLADAMFTAGKFDSVIKTPTGKISTKIENLRKTCNDKELLDLLALHSVAEKYTSSFIEPWLEQAAIAGNRILPHFNQVRGKGEDGGGGARSGRYSSSKPNMQNISANVEDSQNKETLLLLQKVLKQDYDYQFIGLRDYIIPDEDTTLITVDYNQQELRLLAHFEKGILMRAYQEDPNMDVHTFCQGLVKDILGIEFPRKHIKITVFGLIYGMGLEKLGARLEIDRATAKQLRDGILKAIPGVQDLMDELKRLANHDKPLTTWGGRQYFCEEPFFDKKTGRWYDFTYRMLNYKIQPSAADVTKQGMLQVHERVPEVRIAAQVHDELVVMAPNRSYGSKVAHAMCDMRFNVPMTAEAKYSEVSWARATK